MSKQSAVAEPETSEYRLPRSVIPARYEIKLSPDLESFKFDGEVKIQVDVKESVSEVLLNSLELDIKSASASNGSKTLEAKFTLDADSERLKLSFNEALSNGDWTLKIDYTGELNDKLHGFYRSTYNDESGNKRVLGTTQFEATDARRAFPCFDEPDFKAVYKVVLVIDEKLTAISNGSVLAEKNLGNGKKEIEFKDTIKMSTYIVAFVIGDFEATQPVMAGKTPVRVWCVRGKKHLTDFAVSSGVHSLNFFESYYGVPYAGDKLDLIAIPDFAFGAMENLGCVTFRESALLVDQKAASHAELERIADVVAHEIAHMWFGDLTTMSWWNGIWLNEAFATFAEMLAVDDFKPEWKRWNSFGAARAAAFVTDGLKSTRPIEFPVHHPHECEAMFDVLTYEKGASVLRMLEQYLGGDLFRKGVSHYLDKHQFANTETSDLWDAIEHVSKEPVRKLMDSWIFQKGYPMISAELSADAKTLTLSQQRFFYLADTQEKQLFHVPVMLEIKTAKGKESKKLLLTEEKTSVSLAEKAEYVVVNAGGHGFYRVRYSSDLLSKLSDNVFDKLSPIERFNLVNDTWAMTIAGHVSAAEYLKMLSMFKDENDKNVWYIITGSLSYLDRIVADADREVLEKFTQNLLAPALKRLGWLPAAGEDQLTGQLRATIIGTMGTVGNCKETQKSAEDFYKKYLADAKALDPNLVPAVVGVLAASGNKARYEEFVAQWKSGKTPQEEERYLFALAAFPQEDLLKETLTRATNGEVRTQNAPYLLRSVMMNVKGRKLAWEHLKANWEYVTTKYPDNSIARLLEGITALVCPELESDVLKFLKEHPVKQGGKTIDQHIERLNVAVKFKAREGDKLAAALTP
ncbi:MAG: ERAP1-like C-terminal domain-containing protein [Candidatus Obscuribacterales bacterium]|nr:ERAP1-like C-terminal domain-containing protein [Candidatus Obscuribacterales bacterium]